MATHFSDEELEQKYDETTVLEISHQILNPIVAVEEALVTYQFNQIPEPP